MGIYDLGYGGFGALNNNYRINEIPKAEPVKPVEETKPAELKSEPRKLDIQEIDRSYRNADIKDVALSFNKGSDFSYIGSTSDIRSLDVEKAISDMQQDDVLKEYNYFVGSAGNVYSSEDGTVIAK